MAKYPKMPYDSQSPYEQRGQKYEAQETHDQRERRGCGVPDCPMCYPKDESEGDYSKGGNDDMANSAFTVNDLQFVKEMIFAESRGGRLATAPAESEARKAVKEYIFTTPSNTTWDSVIGNEAAREALIEAIETPLKHKDLYARYGMKPLKGVMLWGPPGCGKTMFGKAAAAAIAKLYGKAAELLLVNGATLQSPWVGETELKIKAFFTYAREYKAKHGIPLTIFIDEADAILPSRENSMPWAIANVSTFLAEMDGLEESAAFVILANNRPETIDEALLRDGRCDRKVKVERPSFSAGREIVQNELLKAPVADTALEEFSGEGVIAQRIMDYFVHPERRVSTVRAFNTQTKEIADFLLTLAHIMSGAMLVGLVSRAKGIAFRRDLATNTFTGITLADCRKAVDEILRENIGLPHAFAAQEMLDHLEVKTKIKYNNKMN